MEIIALWFQCKNPNCEYIPPDVNKRRKKLGLSREECKRPRYFMKYAEGVKMHSEDRTVIIFSTVLYGDICIFDEFDKHVINSHINPIKEKEWCRLCKQSNINESLLYGIKSRSI